MIGEIPYDQTPEGAGGPRPDQSSHWSYTLRQDHELRRQGVHIAKLDTGLASLESTVTRSMEQAHQDSTKLFDKLDDANKGKPIWPAVTVSLFLLAALSSALVWGMTSITNQMQRESDRQYKAITETANTDRATTKELIAAMIDGQKESTRAMMDGFSQAMADVTKRFEAIELAAALDDEREKQDRYDQGVQDTEIATLIKQQDHFDMIRHDKEAAAKLAKDFRDMWLGQLESRLSSSETNQGNISQYIKEHTGKEGPSGHPIRQQIIKTESALGVQQKGAAP